MTVGRMVLVVAAAPIGITTHNADGDCHRPPRSCRAATAVARMTMADNRGGAGNGKATQGSKNAKTISYGASASEVD